MNIDWSKTATLAIGAMVANFNHPKGRGHIEFIYSPADRGRYREGPAGWEYIHAPAETELGPWSGEGLPPVGSEQVLKNFRAPVKILAHGISGGVEIAVCQDGKSITLALPDAFIRPEQIYEEDRENQIVAIQDEITASIKVTMECQDQWRKVAEMVHDAGFARLKVTP